MKPIQILTIVTFLGACSSSHKQEGSFQKATSVIIDFTDKRKIYPDSIILTRLEIEKFPTAGYYFSLNAVNDRKQNRRWENILPFDKSKLESLFDEDQQRRNKDIQWFYSIATQAIKDFFNYYDSTQTIKHTELYSILSQEIIKLNYINATKKEILAFTDGNQNMEGQEKWTIQQFDSAYHFPKVAKNIDLIFIYESTSLKNDIEFSKKIEFYKQWFEPKEMHIFWQAQNEIYPTQF